ncbi:hypothetical protein I4U23_015718 [Adineta vaga]|nr:hypothetical protein I4U23_015718 [Adineta vaga]
MSSSFPANKDTVGQLVSNGWRDDGEEDRRRMNKFKSFCERNPRVHSNPDFLCQNLTLEQANEIVVEHMVQYAEMISDISEVSDVVQVDVEFWAANERETAA